jgi:hypothetical protein
LFHFLPNARCQFAPTFYAYGSAVSINSIARKKSFPFEFVHRNRQIRVD